MQFQYQIMHTTRNVVVVYLVKNTILFIPGVSKSGLRKQWNPDLFAQLAKHFEDKGFLICVVGTKKDYLSIEPILNICKNVFFSESNPQFFFHQ